MIRDALLAASGVVLGWALQEFSTLARSRGDRKRAIGRALSVLLDVWHSARVLRTVVRVFKERKGTSSVAVTKYWLILADLLPKSDARADEFQEAIRQIAEFDPLLSFQLRGKEGVPDVINLIRRLSLEHSSPEEFIKLAEETLISQVDVALEKSLRTLAAQFGQGTLKRIDSALRNDMALTEKVRAIEVKLAAASAPLTPAASAPASRPTDA